MSDSTRRELLAEMTQESVDMGTYDMAVPADPGRPECSCCGRRIGPLSADGRCGMCDGDNRARNHAGEEACNLGRSTYTPDPADVELIAKATTAHHLWVGRSDADGNAPCVCGEWQEGPDGPIWDEHIAAVALAALAAAGRLLPSNAEVRTEYGVRLTWEGGLSEDFERGSLAAAEAMHDTHIEERRLDPNWQVTPTLIQRERIAAVGPWQPVPTEDAADGR